MHPLWQKITSLQHKLLWRRRAAAACAVAATAVAAALLLGAADFVVHFADIGLRIMATLALVAAIAWAAYRWAYLPSRCRLAPLAVARRIEQRFPQLNDSLASAVEFLTQSEEDPTSGSAQLRRLVVGEAQNAIEGLSLDEVIDRRPLRRAASWLAVMIFLLVGFAMWDARAVTTALARLVAPFGATEWPRENNLAFRDVPTRLATGQTFEVMLVDAGGPLPDDVRIEYRIAGRGGTEQTSQPMIRAGDTMIARRENVRQSFDFRAIGGDDRGMRWHRVEVVEPPQLEALSILAHPPAYTGLPATKTEGHLDVLDGTAIEVRGTANEFLSAARVFFNGMVSITADIGPSKTREGRSSFHIAPGKWIATKSGPYRLELVRIEGLGGVVGSWNLRVQPDSPPIATWVRPTSDLYVTAAAVVPIEVLVKDNLAIERVDLVYERSNRSESEPAKDRTETRSGFKTLPLPPGEGRAEDESPAADAPSPFPLPEGEGFETASRIELYHGPEKAALRSMSGPEMQGETQTVTHAWDLAPLDLPVGAQYTMHAEAADYRPGIGRTPAPRRLTIISADELEAHLADLQMQIVRQLGRALSLQRNAREEVRRVQAQLKDGEVLEGGERNSLQASELNQRRVKQLLADPADGVPSLVASALEQIEINQLTSTELRALMRRLLAEIEQLSAGPLGVAERELLAANKSVDQLASTSESASLSQFLASAGGAQDKVIASLERLIDELSGKADVRQIARELAELRQDQVAHSDASRAQIGLETLPLQLSELTRSQRAELNKAAAGQSALARRYEKIARAMEGAADQLDENEDQPRAAVEAVELSRKLAIGADMNESARDLSENRVAKALGRGALIADKLQQVIDALRNQDEADPADLVENLREAEERLAALRRQTAALRQQLAESEGQGNTVSEQQLERLNTQQKSLQNDIEQLAAQLDGMQAPDAGQSARSAARRLDNRAADANRSPPQPPRPATSAAAQQAEQDLAQAAEQLTNRRQQREDGLALDFVRRFQAELGEMVKRQQQVIEDTLEIDALRRPDAPLNDAAQLSVERLADEEQALAQLTREHSELLYGLAAVRISLEVAERRLAEAAKFLENRDTGPNAQNAERHALARLEDMFEAFAQTASEAAPNNPAAQPQEAQPTQRPQRRPTFELLEVKMLRILQADLNERTRQFKTKVEGLLDSASEGEQSDLTREAGQLQAEQGQLSELVEEMLNRDNEVDRQ